jgi:hypothetical protein
MFSLPLQGGSITINSSNPFDPPVIDLGMLQSDFDLFTLREALKRAQQFFKAPVWQDVIIGPTQDLENITTDALDTFIRNTVTPVLHLVGSAAMSARDAKHGVVDPDLLVKGVHGLRIIDASVMVSNSFQLHDDVLTTTEAGDTQCTHGCSDLCHCRERSRNVKTDLDVVSRKRRIQVGFASVSVSFKFQLRFT